MALLFVETLKQRAETQPVFVEVKRHCCWWASGMAKRDAETALEEMDPLFFFWKGMENACVDSVVLRKKHVHHRNMRRNMKDD